MINHDNSSSTTATAPPWKPKPAAPPTTETSLLHPFTAQWIQLMEQFYNALGGHDHSSYKQNHCPIQLPEFKCETFYWDDGRHESRDAKHLRPHDIKTVIALGDSISAGFGMLSERPPFAAVWEYRGKAFSSGMDPEEYTIPNFLRPFSLSEGGPEGVTFPMSRGKDLNNAVSGAKFQDLHSEVSRLIHLLNSNYHYRHIKDDWKLITLFIGANNICILCHPPFTGLPLLTHADTFEENMRQVLTRLKQEVPKSFVNVVGLFNVSSVYDAIQGDSYCEFIWGTAHMSICSCVQGDDAQRQAADELVVEYNARLKKLANDPSLSSHDFQVAYQPGFRHFPFSNYQRSYLSGFDCFHPNKCAHEVMALVLWNNMFSSEEEKDIPYDLKALEIKCPGPDRPYLQ
ncbi:hypothetical protein O0I10_000829 [Lichtheimia ornata]|uniref:Phospholipase B1, membrane-associated n=1 Tax=Lichtheimia ornata TaxID=688661 RepID=A0AAD8DHY9_9FUNG|nr:uncharacterized protein O0I10_000829 [Lichtheimia ornata]KAJ8663584.1 hypothetical protein O0I10_000829 [Lichtheimia ornata]